MNTPNDDAARRESIRPSDVIRVRGKVGAEVVNLEITGLRDVMAGASLNGLLDEYRRLATPKQREQLARLAYELADSMLRVRKTR